MRSARGSLEEAGRATSLVLVVIAMLLAPPSQAAEPAEAPSAAAEAATAKFSTTQLEQLVAPIALYPDALTVQMLMAATYPLEIVEADRWRVKNPSLQGDALDKALESQDWDPSVESLTHFPDLLRRMSENLDWTKDLGDAFLGQKDDVLDAVQRMRAKAFEAGTLKTSKEQVVTREVVNEKEIIRVEPASPDVVYVPQYSSQTAYGSAWVPPPTPYYPAMMMYPPGYVATTSLLSFGAGMAVGAAVWGDCDWDHHEVYNNNYYNNGGGGGGNKNQNVNVDREKNVDRSRDRTNIDRGRGDRGRGEGGRQKWQHNPERRGGVRYRDQASAKKYGGRDQVAARDRANRDTARGFDRSQAGGTRPSQRPADARPSQRPAGGRPDARPGGGGQGAMRGDRGATRPSQQPATRPGGAGSRPEARQRDNAFGGYERGGSAREASARGAASRGGPSYAGGGRSGGGGGGGGGFSRGGGGGGGRGGFGGGGRGGGGRGGGGRGGRR